MKSIVKVMEEVLEMPYFRNYQATSGNVHNAANHETAVADVFENHGYKESKVLKKWCKKKEDWVSDKGVYHRDKWLNGEKTDKYHELENCSYISQPCGTHQSPDFILKDENGELFFIECKSAGDGTPMYNSGVPKSKYIYIFTSDKYDATTVYMGEDCLPKEVAQEIQDHIDEARRRDKEINKLLESCDVANNYNISYYTRPMLQHKGSYKKGKDYFINELRAINEANVFAFIHKGA